jgi:hypothetical protein
VEIPSDLPAAVSESLSVRLREERTGAQAVITGQLRRDGPVASWIAPESLGLQEGLMSVRAELTDLDGRVLTAQRRVRIRSWLGGPPIGARQIVHFDFAVDRNEDGRPDFESDLERFGLATPEQTALAAEVAQRVAQHALARVLRAYQPTDDPNETGRDADPVQVRFVLETEPSPLVTRICVGGANLDYPESIGNVRFDHRNERKGSTQCGGPPATGLFPAELSIYQTDPLYQEIFGRFLTARGGQPFGTDPGDAAALVSPTSSERARALERAIATLGDVLGSVMAHESAHALGLVPPGRPGIGLFGGNNGDAYAHNLDVGGNPPASIWLMNIGHGLDFEQLAGVGVDGELRFRPLNHAYLRDRVVLVDGRRG